MRFNDFSIDTRKLSSFLENKFSWCSLGPGGPEVYHDDLKHG